MVPARLLAAGTAMGDKGCCTEALSISPGVERSGSNDSAQMWIQLKAKAEACVMYTEDYHY